MEGYFIGTGVVVVCSAIRGRPASGSRQPLVPAYFLCGVLTGPGGGYCFAPTHALQDNSPTENVLAMYEIAKECGMY